MSDYMAFGTVVKVDRQRVKIETADHREFHFSAGQFEVGQQLLYRWDDLRVYLLPDDYIQVWLAADKKSVTSAHSIVQCQDGMYVGVVDCVQPPVGSDPRLGNIWSSQLGNISFQLRYQFKVGDRVKFKWELNNNNNNSRMKLAEPVILQ